MPIFRKMYSLKFCKDCLSWHKIMKIILLLLFHRQNRVFRPYIKTSLSQFEYSALLLGLFLPLASAIL